MIELRHQRQLTQSFLETALERWSSAGLDAAQGIFLEALDFDGNPLPDLTRRGRVQPRQIFTLALAHRHGLDPNSRYLKIAEAAAETTKAIYAAPEGGWYFSADSAGNLLDKHRYAYEQAFLIMSLSALAQATDKAIYAEQVESAWQWLETLRHSEHGGFQLSEPLGPDSPRDQNPHMHLFEACLESYPLEPERWLARAWEIYQLCSAKFISQEGGVVEFYEEDWTPHLEVGDVLLPGHNFEWSWLLNQYKKLTDIGAAESERLYETGMAWGIDGSGLGIDEIRPGGRVVRGSKRLWVECEVLKGHLARYETTRDPIFLERAQTILAQMFELFFIVDKGVWYDQLDENNNNISANAPASTFYHIFVALQEFLRVTD